MESLGKQIKDARTKLNMSLSDASLLLGISEQMLNAWERDECEPSHQQLNKLEDTLRTVFFPPDDEEKQNRISKATEEKKKKEFRGGKKSEMKNQTFLRFLPLLIVAAAAVVILVIFLPKE